MLADWMLKMKIGCQGFRRKFRVSWPIFPTWMKRIHLALWEAKSSNGFVVTIL